MVFPISEFFAIESGFDMIFLDETADSRGDIDISFRLGSPEPGEEAETVERHGYRFFQNDAEQSIVETRGADSRCELFDLIS